MAFFGYFFGLDINCFIIFLPHISFFVINKRRIYYKRGKEKGDGVREESHEAGDALPNYM